MKKTKLSVLLCTAAMVLTIFGTKEVKAVEQDTVWNYEKQITETAGAFTYHAYLSEDETEVWIYKIDIDKSKKHSLVSIPETMNDKSVTRLGYTKETFNPYDYMDDIDTYVSELDYYDDLSIVESWADLNKNLFDGFVVVWDKADGSYDGRLDGIKEIVIPSSVEVIQPGTFAGLDKVTAITIPKKVTEIKEETFFGCDSLETIKLPANLEVIDISALDQCKKLSNIKLSSKNKVYSVKNKCVITKKDKALFYVLSCDGTLKIPEGVKRIKEYALGNTSASKVNIPASVTKIEKGAFHCFAQYQANKKIKNVTVSKKNKVYAKDGQCIYNKKDKSLSIAIADENKVLVVSDKVEKLTQDYSLVNSTEWGLRKVVFPKTLKYAEAGAFGDIPTTKKVYFTGKKPPKMIIPEDYDKKYAIIGIFDHVYVPKESEKAYKKWFKKYDEYDRLRFHTF